MPHATYHISAKMSRNRGYEIAAETGKKELASSSFSLCVFSDAECGIKRHDFLIAITAKVFGRELDSIGRLVGIHVDL